MGESSGFTGNMNNCPFFDAIRFQNHSELFKLLLYKEEPRYKDSSDSNETIFEVIRTISTSYKT
jgi:hypothetical protein